MTTKEHVGTPNAKAVVGGAASTKEDYSAHAAGKDGKEEEEDSLVSHPSKRPRSAPSTDSSSIINLGKTTNAAAAASASSEPTSSAESPPTRKEVVAAATAVAMTSTTTSTRDEEAVASSGSSTSYVDYHWLDVGEVERHESGELRRAHKGIRVETKSRSSAPTATAPAAPTSVLEIRIGDVVQVASPRPPSSSPTAAADKVRDAAEEEENDDDIWLCRVTVLWSTVDDDDEDVEKVKTGSVKSESGRQGLSSEAMFEGEWLYGRTEVSEVGKGLPGMAWNGMGQDQLVQALGPSERVWTNHCDTNPISTVLRKVNVVFRDPTSPSSAETESPLPPGAYLVRYRVLLTSRSWTVTPWTWKKTPNGDGRAAVARQEAMDADSLSSALDDGGDESSLEDDDDDDDDSSSSSLDSGDDRDLVAMPEGEGSSLRAKISVGQKHQVPVAAFLEPLPVRSRNPTLVWTPGRISEDDLHQFCHQLALILNPYQRKRKLTMADPYSPLSADKTEQAALRDATTYDIQTFQLVQPTNDPWIRTGSHVSSAGRVSAKANPLLKECDVDALLGFLHRHDYDTNEALEDARKNPDAVLPALTTAFTRTEKRLFDDHLRQSSGSLRKVAEGMDAPLTAVIDYWYRFKIPDKFRVYQNKKREQALRMMECIEKRAFTEYATASYILPGSLQTFPVASSRRGPAGSSSSKPDHWSEKAPADVTGAVEERVRSAKSLLLEVKNRLGLQALKRFTSLIHELNTTFDSSTKDELYDALDGYPDLQKKLLDFVP
jgi:hypothetical protein